MIPPKPNTYTHAKSAVSMEPYDPVECPYCGCVFVPEFEQSDLCPECYRPCVWVRVEAPRFSAGGAS